MPAQTNTAINLTEVDRKIMLLQADTQNDVFRLVVNRRDADGNLIDLPGDPGSKAIETPIKDAQGNIAPYFAATVQAGDVGKTIYQFMKEVAYQIAVAEGLVPEGSTVV